MDQQQRAAEAELNRQFDRLMYPPGEGKAERGGQALDVEMAIYRLMQNAPMGPEEINGLVAAYEQTLKALALSDRSDPITNLVARKIIELGQTGVRDPRQLSALAIKALGVASP